MNKNKSFKNLILSICLCLVLTSCADNSDVSKPDSSITIESKSESSSSQSSESKSDKEEKESSSKSESSDISSKPANQQSTSAQKPSDKTLTWWEKGLNHDKLMFHSDTPSCTDPVSKWNIYDNNTHLSWYGNIFWEGDENTIANGTVESNQNADLILNYSAPSDDIGERIFNNYYANIVNLNDDKYTIEFYEKGILIKESLAGKGIENQQKLIIEEKIYEKILNNLENSVYQHVNSEYGERGHVQWLTMMKQSCITDMTFYSSDGEKNHSYDGQGWEYEDVNPIVKNCRDTDLKKLENAALAEINFNNGLRLNVYVNEENLLIYASDIDSSLLYDLAFSSDLNVFNNYAEGQPNPRTGKPVIYLYPEKETDCKVTLDYPRFSYTYPTYENGWFVTAYPDGKLINKKDNSEHYYLFWEGNERINWKYDEGFVVKGEETEKFLREKLPILGLTPREYNDFITYWVPRMKNNAYNLITFAGEQYEDLAPLHVEPKPDSILRVHMVYKPLKQPVEIKEQKLHGFERNGFTVVEWGGTEDR